MSWYVLLFQLPWLPEVALRADDFALIRRLLREDPRRRAFTPDDIERSIDALRDRKSLTAALNYYRAAARGGMFGHVRRIDRPTLLLWGMRDRALTSSLAEGIERFAPRLTVRRFYEATHWLHHEFPGEVNAQIIRFLVS
jgi:pimeloyl-ACP methyl ester carboxylesterase